MDASQWFTITLQRRNRTRSRTTQHVICAPFPSLRRADNHAHILVERRMRGSRGHVLWDVLEVRGLPLAVGEPQAQPIVRYRHSHCARTYPNLGARFYRGVIRRSPPKGKPRVHIRGVVATSRQQARRILLAICEEHSFVRDVPWELHGLSEATMDLHRTPVRIVQGRVPLPHRSDRRVRSN